MKIDIAGPDNFCGFMEIDNSGYSISDDL